LSIAGNARNENFIISYEEEGENENNSRIELYSSEVGEAKKKGGRCGTKEHFFEPT